MEDRLGVGNDPTSAEFALDSFRTALDHLVKVVEDGGLEAHDDRGLVRLMQEFERVRNRMALVDHALINTAEVRRLHDALTQPNVQRILTQALRISAAEAARRVHAAEALGSRQSMLGQPMDAVRPHLAEAQRTGEINAEQVAIVTRALDQIDRRGFDPADIDAGEKLLAGFALDFGSQDLRRLTQQVVDRIDPDGTRPDEEVCHDRRHFTMRATKDGGYTGEFRLTGPLGAKLTSVLGPLTRPQVSSAATADGVRAVPVDERTRGQRWHDALEELCDRALRSGGLPDAGGTPASLIVTIGLDDLLARSGHAATSDGTIVSTRQALSMAAEAEIIPAVLDSGGAVLDLGRTRRIASPSQTLALYARDGGCSFPGCDHPPEYCERHHIVAWIDGGRTALDNLTLLCRYHHHNFFSRGWSCRLNDDRLPEWIPPAWIDRSRRPMINSRIRTRTSTQPELNPP